MNKNKYILLLLLPVFILPSCDKVKETSVYKSYQTSPTPGKSVETDSSPARSGDFAQALNDYNAKNYEKSVKGFQEVVKSDPENQQAHFYLGKSFQNLKKDDNAIAAFKEAVKLTPKSAEANFELGNIYYNRKEYETAMPFYEEALKIDNYSTKMMMALGETYRMQGMHQYSIVQYNKILNYEPENAMAHYNIGITYIHLKNKIAARQTQQTLEKIDKKLAKKLSDLIGE